MVTSTTSSTTKAAVGSSIISSLGASTIDTNSLVDQLAKATIADKQSAIDTRTTANTAEISDLGSVVSSINAFQSSLSTLISGGTLFTQPTTSNSALVGVTAVAGARLNGLNASIQVNQLAASQTLIAPPIANIATSVGQGQLTLTVNGKSATVTIDSTNDSLAGLAQAIKNSGLGVTASTITDSSGARLVIKGPTGSANGFSLALASGDASGLGRFTFDPTTYDPDTTTTGLTRSQVAQDAKLTVDGVSVVKATNSFSDVLAGVTINLLGAAPGTTVTIGSNQPVDAIKQAVSDFVAAYNEVKATLSKLTASPTFNSDGTASGGGSLNQDSGVKQLVQRLGSITSTRLSYATDGSPTTLAEIGISTGLDGTLTLDTAKLATVMTSSPDAVEAMFNPSQRSDNPLIQITSTVGKTKGGVYTVTNAVPGTSTTAASATLDGGFTLPLGATGVQASFTSAAYGLSFDVLGSVPSATITVDPGLLGVLSSIVSDMTSTTGALTASQNHYTDDKTKISDDQTELTARDTTYRDQLSTQFTAMQTALLAYNSTQSYLTQQIKVWTNGTTG